MIRMLESYDIQYKTSHQLWLTLDAQHDIGIRGNQASSFLF